MSNELTLALIRPMPDWTPWLVWKPGWAEMEEAAQIVKSDWKAGKQRMNDRMNGFARSANIEGMSERELFHAVAQQRSGWLCKDLDALLGGQVHNDSLSFAWLVEFLISENLSPAEVEALKRVVQHHGWAKIPIHALEILLGAKWEFDSIRGGAAEYNPNDEIDRKRAAMAINYADLFLTEGDMANLCKKAKVQDLSPTLVLSVREPEKILQAVQTVNRS